MSKLNEGHPVGFIFRRETSVTTAGWKPLVDRNIIKSRNLFRKNLYAHFGCVNAIEFSQDGNLLISGGDDRRILLWQVDKSIHGKDKPVVMQAEHGSNVFALAMDRRNQKIFSAGNDDQVIVHDVKTGAPLDYFIHEQPVYGVSIDPLNDNIFSSACDDGRLYIYDIREPPSSDPFCLASVQSAFHAVMFHPSEPRLIVSGNSKEGVSLWDVRKPKTPLLRYGGLNADQCCMSARFNSDGSKILALRRRLPPVLYSTQETAHLFQFNHTGYYNSCTMKSCCFAGTNDQFILSGSDNFDLYMWKIPHVGADRWVDEAHLVLRGHRSIVNQVRYNQAHSVILSSGVEKLIKVWSPFAVTSGRKFGDSSIFNTHEKERRIFSHTEYINLVTRSGQFMSLTYDNTRKTTREDPRMMAFFDALVQRDIEGWSDDSDNIAENSYAVISPPETSSTEESNDEDAVLVLPTPPPQIANIGVDQQQRFSVTVQDGDDHHHNLNLLGLGLHQHNSLSDNSVSNVNVSNSNQLQGPDNENDNESDRFPNFEGAFILSQSSIYSSNDAPDYPRQSTRSPLSTDDDEDNNETNVNDPFKVSGDPNSDTSRISHADANIIKDLISKKHDRLRQLAKAHVVLETNLKKSGRKRRKLYSSSSSSSSSDNENETKNGHSKGIQNQSYRRSNNNSSSNIESQHQNNGSNNNKKIKSAEAENGNIHSVPSSATSAVAVATVGDSLAFGMSAVNSSNTIISPTEILTGTNNSNTVNYSSKSPVAGSSSGNSSSSSSMQNSDMYTTSSYNSYGNPYNSSVSVRARRSSNLELQMGELSSQSQARNSYCYSEIPSLLQNCQGQKQSSSKTRNSSTKLKRERDIQRRRKFAKFKRLRYEKMIPLLPPSLSTSSSVPIVTPHQISQGPKIICSYHCQAQGRYSHPHPGGSSSSSSLSEGESGKASNANTNESGNGRLVSMKNTLGKPTSTTTTTDTSTSGTTSSSSTTSSRSSPSSTSSSSSSSSSSDDDDENDSSTDTTITRKTTTSAASGSHH